MHDVHEPGGNLVAELRERLQVAGLDVLDDLRGDRRADPGHLRGRAVERELRDRRGRLADARRGAPVGREAEHVGAVQLEQIREQIELRRDLGVRRERAFGLTRR